MFSHQQTFGEGDRFHGGLEGAAREADGRVRLVIEYLKAPCSPRRLDGLMLARHKDNGIVEQIREETVKNFFSGLDREEAAALSVALHRIPKTVEKFAEWLALTGSHLDALDSTCQAEVIEKVIDRCRDAGNVVISIVLNNS
jgi:uncharacterized protein